MSETAKAVFNRLSKLQEEVNVLASEVAEAELSKLGADQLLDRAKKLNEMSEYYVGLTREMTSLITETPHDLIIDAFKVMLAIEELIKKSAQQIKNIAVEVKQGIIKEINNLSN